MKKLLRQHNVITEARYRMSALEKNIVYMLMSLLPEEVEETRYEMRLIELEQLKGGEIKGRELSRAARQLVKRTLMIYDSDTKKFLGLKIISSSKYLKGHLVLEVDQAALPFFTQLRKNFTTLDFGTAMSLRSVYSKRIYEMLSQYRDTGVLHVSIHEMKCRLGLIDPDTGAEKYTEFALFRKYVLEQARKELSEKSNISFTYRAIKTGKKFTHLQINIQIQGGPPQKQLTAPLDEVVEEEGATIRKLVEKYQLSPWQAERIVKQVPLREIGKTTYAIQIEVLNNNVHNLGGYTAKVFTQKYNLDLGFKSTKPSTRPKESPRREQVEASSNQVSNLSNPTGDLNPAVAARGACYKRLILDFGLEVLTVSRIAQQIPADKLERFLDKIVKEIKRKDMALAEKAQYVLKRLREEHQLTL